MTNSARVAEMLQRERRPTPRFVWGEAVDPDEPQRRRIFLLHRIKPRFVCEIKLSVVATRDPRAPAVGYWFTEGPVKYWGCDEFVAYEFDFIDSTPSDAVLDSILMTAVPSLRRRQQQERPQKPSQQTEAPPTRKQLH